MLEPTTKSQHEMNCNQLLPTVIDDRAISDPDGAFTKVPILNSYDNGYQVVTNANLAAAVDYVARLISSEFGQSNDHECIAYLGLSDLRYIIVLLAGIKTGFKLFFPYVNLCKTFFLLFQLIQKFRRRRFLKLWRRWRLLRRRYRRRFEIGF